jgi:uncharacterized protein YuzE
MKLKVDEQADALHLTLGEAPTNRSEEVSPGIIVDYDDQDRVVGIGRRWGQIFNDGDGVKSFVD